MHAAPTACLCSYTCLYLNRGTLTFTAPVMVNDPLLGLTKTDIGAMTSAFPAAYGEWLGGGNLIHRCIVLRGKKLMRHGARVSNKELRVFKACCALLAEQPFLQSLLLTLAQLTRVTIAAAVGLSKFLKSMLGAAFSPRLMLALGLIATSGIKACCCCCCC
jgi:sugar phosphate permease